MQKKELLGLLGNFALSDGVCREVHRDLNFFCVCTYFCSMTDEAEMLFGDDCL